MFKLFGGCCGAPRARGSRMLYQSWRSVQLAMPARRASIFFSRSRSQCPNLFLPGPESWRIPGFCEHAHIHICPSIHIHTHIYIYIYIYPPTPACQGPPVCEEYCSNQVVPSPFNHLSHKLTVKFSFPVMKSAYSMYIYIYIIYALLFPTLFTFYHV
jgi:hypothetical protein